MFLFKRVSRLSIAVLMGVFLRAEAQTYLGPIPKPSTGYGAEGAHSVSVDSFENPNYLTKNIYIYYPSDVSGKIPTIFYSHAYGGHDPNSVIGLLHFIARKGYAVVFVPYQTAGITMEKRYDNLISGFALAVKNRPDMIDTTKVGFMGWSFGGGASISISYKFFTQYNWGQKGRFVYPLAQWYTEYITQAELQSFPTNTKLLTEVFDADSINDHHMAVEIFNNINIPVEEKDFIVVKQDTVDAYAYLADHGVPSTRLFDAYDYYAIYRLLDALCDYTFNDNPAGKETALGNGGLSQITMPGGLKELVQTDAPVALYPESIYLFTCSGNKNPRSEYCSSSTGTDSAMSPTPVASVLTAMPNPFNPSVNIKVASADLLAAPRVQVFDMQGRLVFQVTPSPMELGRGIVWNASRMAGGMYVVYVKDKEALALHKRIVLAK